MNKYLLLILSVLSVQTSQACESPHDQFPHATKIEKIDAQTYRVFRPFHVYRFGGGAPGHVYYSRFSSKNKICRDLLIDHDHLNAEYVKGSMILSEKSLPGKISGMVGVLTENEKYIQSRGYGADEIDNPLAIHGIETLDCRVGE